MHRSFFAKWSARQRHWNPSSERTHLRHNCDRRIFANAEILPPGTNPQNYIPYPSFARNSTYETTNAVSSYNSLQASYEHQMSAGLYLLGNYTWSMCLTDQYIQAGQNQHYRAEWLPGFGISGDYAPCDSDATNPTVQ